MEWNLKSPSWDLAQFGHEPDSDNNLVDGSSSSMVDLKLGRVTNCGDESKGKLKELGSGTKMTGSSPSGSSKRARAGGNNFTTQMASCLVDGCVSDLKNCREYHRRHKVCELHSKTPQVIIGGLKQRFCQQCSRFHSLEEFDEGKRSCRKRLDGHNRRRRKPQPEPMSSNSYLSNYPGTRLFPFSPLNLMTSPTWPGPSKTMEEAFLYNDNNKGMSRFPFMQGENPMFINNIDSSQNGGSSTSSSNHRIMFTTRVPNSDCALSLLSSLPPPPPLPMQPLVVAQRHYNGIDHADPMIDVGTPNVHCHGFFHMDMDQNDDESCSYSDAPQTLRFYWD